MNKKAIGSIFTVIALVLALLKSSVWVIIGLLVASVVLALEEKHIKRIAQCLMLLFSVLVVTQLISLIFGGFTTSGASIFWGGSDYDNFYAEMTKWIGVILNFYLIVFVILGAVFVSFRQGNASVWCSCRQDLWYGHAKNKQWCFYRRKIIRNKF